MTDLLDDKDNLLLLESLVSGKAVSARRGDPAFVDKTNPFREIRAIEIISR